MPLGSALLDAPDKGIEWPKGDSASFFVSFGSGDKTEQYHLVNVQLLIRCAHARARSKKMKEWAQKGKEK